MEPIQKWEYENDELIHDEEDEEQTMLAQMNRRGAEGWELVSVTELPGSEHISERAWAIWKRPLADTVVKKIADRTPIFSCKIPGLEGLESLLWFTRVEGYGPAVTVEAFKELTISRLNCGEARKKHIARAYKQYFGVPMPV